MKEWLTEIRMAVMVPVVVTSQKERACPTLLSLDRQIQLRHFCQILELESHLTPSSIYSLYQGQHQREVVSKT